MGLRNKAVKNVLYGMVLLLTLLPLTGSRIMSGGLMGEWTMRTAQEMSLACRISLGLLQVGTLFFAKTFFEAYFAKEEEGEIPALMGVLLYMTGPFRLGTIYDSADVFLAAAWMLIPLYAWAICHLRGQEGKMNWYAVVAGLALTGMGYAHVTVFLVVSVGSLIYFLCQRKYRNIQVLIAGAALLSPGMCFAFWLRRSAAYENWFFPWKGEAGVGYDIGGFFTIFRYQEGHPGLGLGLMLGLGYILWLRFVEGKKSPDGRERIFIWVAALLGCFALRFFPWVWLQQLGKTFHFIVWAVNSPAVFWGMACSCLCVPVSAALGRMVNFYLYQFLLSDKMKAR